MALFAELRVGAHVQVILPLRHVLAHNLVSREWRGEIVDIECFVSGERVGAPRTLAIRGVPVIGPAQYCRRCGQYLASATSQLFGYGPGCADVLGIPAWASCTPEQVEELTTALAAAFEMTLNVPVPGTTITVLQAPMATNTHDGYDVRFSVEGNAILVMTTYAHRNLVRTVPGATWDNTRRVWRLPATPSVARQLRRAFDGYRRVGTKAFIALLEQATAQDAAQALKTREDLPPIPHIKGGGWKHQRAAFAFMVQMLTGRNPYDRTDAPSAVSSV